MAGRVALSETIYDRIVRYTDQVLKGKPSRKTGQDLRDLPTYTIPEASLFLGIPERTTGYWFASSSEILSPADHYGAIALLSFRDLAEAYILALLTKFYEFPMLSIRQFVKNAKRETGSERPLIEASLTVLFHQLVLEKPTRRNRPRQMLDLAGSGKQSVFPELVDQLGKRIPRDVANAPIRIYPWRLVTESDESRPVSIDPDVLSGRLTVTGTRIPVRALLGKKHAGRSMEQIANSYHIGVETVEKALLHIERLPVHNKAA
jgi:uncharacterized protein (DUF433 family)